MKRSMRFIALAATLVLALSLVSACSSGQPSEESGEVTGTPTVPEATTTPEPTTELPIRLYFVRGEYVGVAGRILTVAEGQSTTSPDFLAGIVTGLLEGPTQDEREWGLGTTIPEGTTVRGVKTSGNVATVDFSAVYESGGGSLSMLLRVAQVVCTLTQFEGIDKVGFEIEGKPAESIGGEGVIVSPPVGREDFEGQLPAILVEGPTPGEEVTSPVRVWGSSNTFEATHQLNITDPDGLIIAEKTVTATSGTGTRGTWSVSVPFQTTREGLGAVIAFEYSAKDGSQINVVEIPVRMSQ